MSLKKILVAGFAVVGTVAMVNAQHVITAGDGADNDRSISETMTMSVEVTSVIDMVVNPTSITPSQFQTHDPKVAGGIKGSLATVDVTCTRANWDVTLVFANGGYLESGRTLIPGTTCPDNPSPFDPPCSPTNDTWDSGTRLKVSTGGGTPAAKQLAVAVGVVTGNTANAGATDIATATLTAAVDADNAISLANEIGTKLGASGTIAGAFGTTVGDDIKDDGFPGADADKTIRLWINAGLDLGTTGRVTGNADGTYEENVIITLVPSF